MEHVERDWMYIIATRAATFDLLTRRYLADHPDATVLHLGCGMDSRVFRVDPARQCRVVRSGLPDVDRPAPPAVSRARRSYH